jgi:hypothetical protein
MLSQKQYILDHDIEYAVRIKPFYEPMYISACAYLVKKISTGLRKPKIFKANQQMATCRVFSKHAVRYMKYGLLFQASKAQLNLNEIRLNMVTMTGTMSAGILLNNL